MSYSRIKLESIANNGYFDHIVAYGESLSYDEYLGIFIIYVLPPNLFLSLLW